MATFDDQVLRAWDEWEATTGADANNPDDFVVWATARGKLAVQPQDLRRLLRKQVTRVLRNVMRTDANGITYRAKQCVQISEQGIQIPLWFDIDKGGTPNLRQKAVRQRRDGIANDVYRALCDVDHMRTTYPGEQLSFHLDFTDDCAEKRAAEVLAEEEKDDAA